MRLALAEFYKAAHLLFKAVAVVLNLLGGHHGAHIGSARRVAYIPSAAADKGYRAVARHLQPLHKAKRHKVTHMQAVRRRIKAYVEGRPAVIYKLAYLRLIRYLRNKSARYKFIINFHDCLLLSNSSFAELYKFSVI